MTIQQHASFDSSAAELNATSKLVKAWESKNAKNAAKAGGVSLMALSLAACGGSSETVDLTPFDQADIDAAVNTVKVDLTAVNDELTAANLEFETANGELKTINVDLAADLDDAEDAVALLQATIDEIDADDLEAIEALAALGVDGTLELDEVLAAVAALNDDASFESGAASRDDEVSGLNDTVSGLNDTVTGLNDTITAIDNTDAASEQEAFDDGAASRDDEVANLQAQIDALLDADAALDARTLDADNETFAAGDATDFDIIVSGTTADADTLTATVTGSGTGTLSFTFADLDDTVTLTADSDLSSYSKIVITAGKVDLTAATLADGVAIEINSGAVMTAPQFLAAVTIESEAGTGTLEVVVSSLEEAEQVSEQMGKVTGVTTDNLSFTNAPGSTATDGEVAGEQTNAKNALAQAGVEADLMGSLSARLDSLDDATEAAAVAVLEATSARTTALDNLVQARVDALSNDLVAAAAEEALVAAVEAGTNTDIDEIGETDVEADVDAAIVAVEEVLETAIGGDYEFDDNSDAVDAASISDTKSGLQNTIDGAEAALATTTAVLEDTLIISRAADLAADVVITNDTNAALIAAEGAANQAALVLEAIVNANDDGDNGAIVFATGIVSFDGVAPLVALFDTADGVVSLSAAVTVNAVNSALYDIAYGAAEAATTLSVSAAYVDDLLDAVQGVVTATATDTAAIADATASSALLTDAYENAGIVNVDNSTGAAAVVTVADDDQGADAGDDDAVAEVVTVTVTDGDNSGLSAGDVMSITVGDAIVEITADATSVSFADALAALATEIADEDTVATATVTDNVITITMAEGAAVADDNVNSFTVTDGTDAEQAGAALDDYEADVTDLDNANTALTDFNEAVADRDVLLDLRDDLVSLDTEYDSKDTALTAATNDNDAQLAALAAIENAVVAAEGDVSGLNIEVDGILAGNSVNDLLTLNYVLDADDGLAGEVTVFGDTGMDVIDMGDQYTFVTLNADADPTTEVTGDASVLEAFFQEVVAVDETTSVQVFVETLAADGSAAVFAAASFTIENGDGDLTLAAIEEGFNQSEGLVILGTYDAGIV